MATDWHFAPVQRFDRWIIHIDEQCRQRDDIRRTAALPAGQPRTPQPDREVRAPAQCVRFIELRECCLQCSRIVELEYDGTAWDAVRQDEWR